MPWEHPVLMQGPLPLPLGTSSLMVRHILHPWKSPLLYWRRCPLPFAEEVTAMDQQDYLEARPFCCWT
jgi:hypothetical protein